MQILVFFIDNSFNHHLFIIFVLSSMLVFQDLFQLLMAQLVQLQLAQLILVYLLHWLLWRLLPLNHSQHRLWHVLAVLQRLGTWIVFFLLFTVNGFRWDSWLCCVYHLYLIGELLHLVLLLSLLLPLLAANIRPQPSQLYPLFITLLGD